MHKNLRLVWLERGAWDDCHSQGFFVAGDGSNMFKSLGVPSSGFDFMDCVLKIRDLILNRHMCRLKCLVFTGDSPWSLLVAEGLLVADLQEMAETSSGNPLLLPGWSMNIHNDM